MLRTSIFSVLSICLVSGFADRDALVRNMKNGIHKYLKHDR